MQRCNFIAAVAAGISLAATRLVDGQTQERVGPKTDYATLNGLKLYYEVHCRPER